MKPVNIFSDLPDPSAAEFVEIIAGANTFRIERIISHGHASPEGFWYDQEQGEWVIVLKGRARLKFFGSKDSVELGPGDYVNIPPHERHRVEWTDPAQDTIWLAVHWEGPERHDGGTD